jgi:hypothetical protein
MGGLGEAHRGELDPHHLELGRQLRAVIGGVRLRLRDVVGQHLGLLPQGRHEPVDAAAMLRALAHDIDIGIVDRAHMVVDHDGALDGEAAAQADL